MSENDYFLTSCGAGPGFSATRTRPQHHECLKTATSDPRPPVSCPQVPRARVRPAGSCLQ
ncbi:hypothetical protein C8Q70DRAFT_977785 [Cubamyces menziesii]|nr:hypothetical protein C8Q70DRAFT_997893 [Cubamyces menziesii]KAI0660049.1 hypothetical protein C8Q70DRAFT_977785 [Cubamyces menziesii]